MSALYQNENMLKTLSEAFGPSGYEDAVAALIAEYVQESADAYCRDKLGNLIFKVCGGGPGYHAENPTRVMIAGHMDEIGMMVRRISDEGCLYFALIGEIDVRALCGRRVRVMGKNGEIPGVIATKAIHLQSAQERRETVPVNKLYIDIGAESKEEAEELAPVGSFATFDSDFYAFGQDGRQYKGKAFGGRSGCAAMVAVMQRLHEQGKLLPFDLYFAFTKCGEIGLSAGGVAANGIDPDYAIVLDAIESADYDGVPEGKRICSLGQGAVVPYLDPGTIYDRSFVDFAFSVSELYGVPVQGSNRLAGGSDARVLQSVGTGIRTMSIQLPVRNRLSASCVAMASDCAAVENLLYSMLTNWKMN